MSIEHEDRGKHVLAAAIGFFIPSIVTVGLRVCVRFSTPAGLGTDDWLMLACMVLTTIYTALQITSVHYGNGAHLSTLTPASAATATEYWFLGGLIYEPATVLLKLSINSFLHRFTTQRWQTTLLHILSASLVLFGLTYWFFLLLQCTPVAHFWALGPGHCISVSAFIGTGYGAAALNATADALYAGLPLAIIYRSTWRLRAKITVCVLLSLGSLAAVATVARAVLAYTTEGVYAHTDFLFDAVPVAVLSTAELGIGITAASAGTLRPLFERVFRPAKRPVGVPGQLWLDRIMDDVVRRLDISDGKDRARGRAGTLTGVEDLDQMPDLVFAAMAEMEKGKGKGLILTVGETRHLGNETDAHGVQGIVVGDHLESISV